MRQHRPSRAIAGFVLVVSLALASLATLGVSAAGAAADRTSGPIGTVITMTVPNCGNGLPGVGLYDPNSDPIVFSFGLFGSGVVQVTVPGTAEVGVTYTVIGQCDTYNNPPTVLPDEFFLVTNGSVAEVTTDGGPVTITVADGLELSDVSAGNLPAGAPDGIDFPYGVIGFTISGLADGATTTVTITVPDPIDTYWKFQGGTWSEFSQAAFNGNTVTLTLTDGGAGDADGVANGVIVDPGAPGITDDVVIIDDPPIAPKPATPNAGTSNAGTPKAATPLVAQIRLTG